MHPLATTFGMLLLHPELAIGFGSKRVPLRPQLAEEERRKRIWLGSRRVPLLPELAEEETRLSKEGRRKEGMTLRRVAAQTSLLENLYKPHFSVCRC